MTPTGRRKSIGRFILFSIGRTVLMPAIANRTVLVIKGLIRSGCSTIESVSSFYLTKVGIVVHCGHILLPASEIGLLKMKYSDTPTEAMISILATAVNG